MCMGDIDVVTEDRKAGHDVVEERSSGLAALAAGDLDTDAKFCDRDRGDGGLVVVGDERVEVES